MDDAPPDDPHAQPRVLLISADPVGKQMAGLGIRYWELARTLSAHARVTLAHGGSEAREHEGVRTVPYRPHAPGPLRALIADADVVVTHPQWPLVNRWLKRSQARIVIDLYCPETLETLELLSERRAFARSQLTATTLDRLHASLRVGHHFMCASETQRDLWLGAMLALRLIDPQLYDRDPALRSVIDLVPFGVPDDPPAPDHNNGPRQVIAGLDEDSEIVLWNGGIWRWLDPHTAIRAVVMLAERRPSVTLVFMGGGSSHPAAAQSTRAARELAHELGALDSTVHFHEEWVPYAQRATWLTQAACSLSTHRDHLETRFAFRTRLLDCFWAGLPVVCTGGDDLAELVTREGLGEACAPGDVEGVAAALERVLVTGRDAYGPALQTAASRITWPQVTAPLNRWIQSSDVPSRVSDTPAALRVPLAQRVREAAYLFGGRAILARR